ncbi:hypothetical protein [Umezawaea beigongshangensis]|uniref:hypothetical protein n=1 Tax=Umezawaea beigongshangensis TaxID=2780383 RepID=UPI0018F231EC|nr:hypothetical protein [Umezawaea beigongshangensis]
MIGAWTVPGFLRWWYGEPDLAGARPAAALPGALLDLHEALSRHSVAHDGLLAPRDVRADDGVLVFWVERRGLYEWGAGPDGLVRRRTALRGEPWHRTGAPLAEFLVSLLVHEAVVGARYRAYADDLSPGRRDLLLDPLRPLPLPGPTAGSRLYAGEHLLALAGERGGTSWVHLAARRPGDLQYLEAVLG